MKSVIEDVASDLMTEAESHMAAASKYSEQLNHSAANRYAIASIVLKSLSTVAHKLAERLQERSPWVPRV